MNCMRQAACLAAVLTGVALAAPPEIELATRTDPASGTDVRVGVFRVHEDRDAREGLVLELDLVVLPALADEPAQDPVFVIVGGPGQNAAHGWRGWAGHWMRQDRDIVLVSQRGTGGNNRLACDLPASDDNLQAFLEPIFDPESFRDCAEELARRYDLSRYSTCTASEDLDDLCRLLGYEVINLYGGSYGSRAELEFIRHHPERVRSAVLNSVAPVSFVNPLYHAISAQAALDAIFEECESRAEYRARFGDIRAKFDGVMARLEAEPARATVRHPVTGERVSVRLSRDAFAETLRVMMYTDSRSVPRVIDRAHRGEFDEFAQRGLERNRALRNSLALGMLMCVTCTEDVARIRDEDIAPLTDGTFLGDVRIRRQVAACADWPESIVCPPHAEPVTSDVPVMLISGTLDPVTRPWFGEEAASHLANSLHVVVPGSHGNNDPCVQSIMRRFLEGASPDVDCSCVWNLTLPAFNMAD
jgi:pimeloyl-ACP methyl ester carboxylesterase